MARTRDYIADLEELEGEYQEARNEEFREQLEDFLEKYVDGAAGNVKDITEDDLQGFLDSFTFLDEAVWCAAEYESRRDSFEDARYEEEKDRRMGL